MISLFVDFIFKIIFVLNSFYKKYEYNRLKVMLVNERS
jgi:hypothetical protein